MRSAILSVLLSCLFACADGETPVRGGAAGAGGQGASAGRAGAGGVGRAPSRAPTFGGSGPFYLQGDGHWLPDAPRASEARPGEQADGQVVATTLLQSEGASLSLSQGAALTLVSRGGGPPTALARASLPGLPFGLLPLGPGLVAALHNRELAVAPVGLPSGDGWVYRAGLTNVRHDAHSLSVHGGLSFDGDVLDARVAFGSPLLLLRGTSCAGCREPLRLVAIDTSDPDAPRVDGSIDLDVGGPVAGLVASVIGAGGSIVVERHDVSRRSSTISFVSVGPSRQLSLGPSIELPGIVAGASSMSLRGGKLWVVQSADDGVWLGCFDVATGAACPWRQALFSAPSSPHQVAFGGDMVHVVQGELRSFVFDDEGATMLEREGPEVRWFEHIEAREGRLWALVLEGTSTHTVPVLARYDVVDRARLVRTAEARFDDGSSPAHVDDPRGLVRSFDGLFAVQLSTGALDACGHEVTGVAMVDASGEGLAAAGLLPLGAGLRGASLQGDVLELTTDSRLVSFDVSQRQAPSALGEARLSAKVLDRASSGGRVFRLVEVDGQAMPVLELLDEGREAEIEPRASLALEPLLPGSTGRCLDREDVSSALFAQGDRAALLWGTVAVGSSSGSTHLATFSAAKGSLSLLGVIDEPRALYTVEARPKTLIVDAGARFAQIGSSLVVLERGDSDDALVVYEAAPDRAPRYTYRRSLGALGGVTSMLSRGTVVHTSTYREEGSQLARFYLRRHDLSAPDTPLPEVELAGSLAAVDGPTGRLLTISYERDEQPSASGGCGPFNGWNEGAVCVHLRRRLHLEEPGGADLSQMPVDEGWSRLRAVISNERWVVLLREDGEERAAAYTPSVHALVLEGIGEGRLSARRFELGLAPSATEVQRGHIEGDMLVLSQVRGFAGPVAYDLRDLSPTPSPR